MSEDAARRHAAASLLRALPFVMRAIGEGMRESGIDMSPVQHRLLMQIAHTPRTLREIARLQGVTPATATSLVTTLENKGWVARAHSAQDRRSVSVALTPAGHEALKAGQEVAEAAVARLVAPLDDEELARLTDGLGALDGVMHC